MITVEAVIRAPLARVWEYWTGPEHIPHWNFASDDWMCPLAKNDLRSGGRFSYEMAAKDGSVRFNFEGMYDSVDEHKRIAYTMDDGRRAEVIFEPIGEDETRVVERFDPEQENPQDMQRSGWQTILNNFKYYAERG